MVGKAGPRLPCSARHTCLAEARGGVQRAAGRPGQGRKRATRDDPGGDPYRPPGVVGGNMAVALVLEKVSPEAVQCE